MRGVGEFRGDLDLAQEPLGADALGKLGGEHLDGDLAVVLLVLSEVDGGIAPTAELTVYGVAIGEGLAQRLRNTGHGVRPW